MCISVRIQLTEIRIPVTFECCRRYPVPNEYTHTYHHRRCFFCAQTDLAKSNFKANFMNMIWFFSAYRKNWLTPFSHLIPLWWTFFGDALDRHRQSDSVTSFLNSLRWLYWFWWNNGLLRKASHSLSLSPTKFELVSSALIENTSRYDWVISSFCTSAHLL